MKEKRKEDSIERFDQAVGFLPYDLKRILKNLPVHNKEEIQEVRVRAGKPLSVFTGTASYFVTTSSKLTDTVDEQCYQTTPENVYDSFRSLCAYSIHTHQEEIAEGYIAVEGGHRAGICGTAVNADHTVTGVRNITSINLRIAREKIGAADELMQAVFRHGMCGLIIAGPPSSGKTTLLRDLTRQLASGDGGRVYKVAVVDERGELGAAYSGVVQNDLGVCSDVLDKYEKSVGILQAVRTLSPQVIVCDELGGEKETQAVAQGLNSGVSVITTIHADSPAELLKKPQARALLQTGAFDKIAFLKGSGQPGKLKYVMDAGDLYDQMDGMCHDSLLQRSGGDTAVQPPHRQSDRA